MKTLSIIILVAAAACMVLTLTASCFGNPIFDGWYADPQIRRYGDTWWIFPTGSGSFAKQPGFDAFSSKDMKTWTRHPGVLTTNDVAWAKGAMWAPDAHEVDGRYYIFFSANDAYPVGGKREDGEPQKEAKLQGYGGIGVAVAERPEGPYRDLIGKPLVDRFWNRAQPIDQYVFEYGGEWYMVYGGWGRCNLVKLAKGFKSLVPFEDGSMWRDMTPKGYVEGPVMFERDGKWYFMYSGGSWTGDDYCVNYSVGKSPFGPFEFKGKVLGVQRPIATGAGHHSVARVPGTDEWYICYHRRPIPNEGRNHRVVCIDRMEFDANGEIKPIVMTESKGSDCGNDKAGKKGPHGNTVGMADGGNSVPERGTTSAWRPSVRWRGFNLLGMFCQTKMEAGDKRIFGYFPEDRFQWMEEWGFNFARLPLDYRFFVEEGDWMKPVESQLKKLDDAVRYGKKHGIHVQINFHRAPGYCCNPPQEAKSLFRDSEPLVAFTNLWTVLAQRYRGIPNEELSFDLLNEPAPVAPYGATPSNYAAVARAALAAIRAVDPGRFVMSDGWMWGSEPVEELHSFDSASGESIHCYKPHGITHYRVFNRNDPKPCPPWPPVGWTNGVEWLEKNVVDIWRPAIGDGTFIFAGELGCHQGNVPHATYLAWLEDTLMMCKRHGWGWALWNLDGTFGILDTPRTDCEFEDFHGHKLDRKALELLRRH